MGGGGGKTGNAHGTSDVPFSSAVAVSSSRLGEGEVFLMPEIVLNLQNGILC